MHFFVVLCIFYVVLCIFYVVLCIFVLFYVFFMLFYVFSCCSMYFLCCSMYFRVVLCIFYVVLCIFVLFCVLFVCICVLYYCHRVATQLQLTKYIISYHKANSGSTEGYLKLFCTVHLFNVRNENQLMSLFYSYIAGSLHVSGPQVHLQESSYSCSHNHWFSICATLFACSVC